MFKHNLILGFLLLYILAISGCSHLNTIPPSDAHLKASLSQPSLNSSLAESNGETSISSEIKSSNSSLKQLLVSEQTKSSSLKKSSKKFNLTMYKQSINQLLFVLAKDAHLNLDIHPEVKGEVNINAIQKTLPEILERLNKQVDFTYEILNNTLIIYPNKPYFKSYYVDYLNQSRDSVSEMNIAGQVASTNLAGNRQSTTNSNNSNANYARGGRNNPFSRELAFESPVNQSVVNLINASSYRLWDRLIQNIREILSVNNDKIKDANINTQNEKNLTSQQDNTQVNHHANNEALVIPNPEAGMIMIKATASQHKLVENFIKTVMKRSQKQVLIEATLVEVSLSDDYKQGIDWQKLTNTSDGRMLSIGQKGNFVNGNVFFTYANANSALGNISTAVNLLETFGQAKVLSSPKLSTLNNQTALLKVVDNHVYFTIDVDYIETTRSTTSSASTSVFTPTYRTNINTVPIGFVMNVTPQIDNQNRVTLNIRPSITRIVDYVADPNPTLATTNVKNLIPVVQTRELETVLRVNSGDIAVIGGLMEDTTAKKNTGLPPLLNSAIGRFLNNREDVRKKTELVIFLRPVVLDQQNRDIETQRYGHYLN